MHPFLTVFSRLVNCRRLLPGTTLFLALFAKRWPDLSESSPNLPFLITDILSRHIIQELQKESANASHQNKLLESENKLLLSETEQLRKVILWGIFHPRNFLKQDHRTWLL